MPTPRLASLPGRDKLSGMKRIATLAVLSATILAAAGCTDFAAQRAASLNALVGQPETAVVAQFGVPAKTFEAGGHRYLAYTATRSEVIGGGGFYGGGFGGYGYGGGYGGIGAFTTIPTEIVARTCETSFDIVAGRVQGWALHGNAC